MLLFAQSVLVHTMESTLYQDIADQIQQQIRQAVYKQGEKLPSVRNQAGQQGVSVSTILAAYTLLEDRGAIEARPKSGYYVRQAATIAPPPPVISQTNNRPKPVTTSERVKDIIRYSNEPGYISFGAAAPCSNFPVSRQLRKIFADLLKREPVLGIGYDPAKGIEVLRRQLARRAVDAGVWASPDDIVTAAGCQGAVGLALRAITQPGDLVAVESPSFYGLLQVYESLGLKAIEIPSDAEKGMSIEALRFAMTQWPIKAVLCTPCFNNPVGALMPDEHKQALIDLVYEYDIPLIEDDIYGELAYDNHRPKAIKAFDTKGQVLLCSSVSKTLDPQLGIGWVIAGKYLERVEHERHLSSTGSFRLPQLAVAEILAQGGYDRHLRLARQAYRQRRDRLLDLISAHFPAGTRVSQPKGGFVAWIQLPGKTNTNQLYEAAKAEGIIIAPGEIFSASPNKFTNAFRISYAREWTPARENAIKTLAGLI